MNLFNTGYSWVYCMCANTRDDAETLDKAWCAVSLGSSHRVLSSVQSGVIGISCLHGFIMLAVCCWLIVSVWEKLYNAISFSVFADGIWRSNAMYIPRDIFRLDMLWLLVTNGVWPLVDCCCKESFEVFSAVRVSQLMYAFVCKFPAWNLFPCGFGLCKVFSFTLCIQG